MPHTLLLADDSVTIQRVIELTFADEDIEVVAVSDGDEAIASLEARPPDIVLADIGMPGKNGYEVARHVKESPRLAHIPVVLLTGAFEPIDQAAADEAGCDGVLAKPFEPQLVIGRVRELLARPKAASVFDEFRLPESAGQAPGADDMERAAAPKAAGAEPRIDDYFDRLDEAFASFSQTTRPAPPAEITQAPAAPPAVKAPAVVPHQPDTFWPGAEPVVAEAPEPAHAAATVPTSFPPLADAFAALLAAEQESPAAPAAPVWPAAAAPPAPAPAAPVIGDDLVDGVVERVMERLTDRVVRERTGEIVSAIAERLIREEIDKIKNAIR